LRLRLDTYFVSLSPEGALHSSQGPIEQDIFTALDQCEIQIFRESWQRKQKPNGSTTLKCPTGKDPVLLKALEDARLEILSGYADPLIHVALNAFY
jgi:hypothetical protein